MGPCKVVFREVEEHSKMDHLSPLCQRFPWKIVDVKPPIGLSAKKTQSQHLRVWIGRCDHHGLRAVHLLGQIVGSSELRTVLLSAMNSFRLHSDGAVCLLLRPRCRTERHNAMLQSDHAMDAKASYY